MFKKSLVSLLLFCLFLFGAVGCSSIGLGGGNGEIGLIEFEPDPPTPVPEEVVGLALSMNPDVMQFVSTIYELQLLYESVDRMNRDLVNLVGSGEGDDYGLEWVIEVHEVTQDAETLYRRVAAFRLPENLRSEYDNTFIDLLQVIQLSSVGSDRILSAAILIGPSGRSMRNLQGAELERFERLRRESRLYLNEAQSASDAVGSSLESVVGQMSLR